MAKEHKIEVLKTDKERVQMRPTIYIPTLDERGALHCIYEIVDNSLDELNIDNPVGDTIIVKFDDKTKECEVIDNGGGIPHKSFLDSLTKLNSSGKFHNDDESHFKMSVGINGCGVKLNTYLSEYAIVSSSQKGKKITYEFKNGDLVNTKEEKTKGHGTAWRFKLSKKFLDIGNVTAKMVKARLKEKSYVNPHIKMQFVELNGGKVVKTSQYHGKDIQSRFDMFEADTASLRTNGTKKISILERVSDDKLTEKKVVYDIVFGFKEAVMDDDAPDEHFIVSYANGATTYRHGTHLDGLRDGLVKFFRDDINSRKKDSDPTIMPSDCYAGLCAVITASVQNPVFRGQFKDSITNQEVKFAVRDATVEALNDAPKSVIKQFEEFIKRVAKGRVASKKIRRKDVANSFSSDRIECYTKFNRTDKTTYPELIITEGKSAASNVVNVRDPYNQGVFYVKKPANVFDVSTETVNTLATAFNQIMDIFGLKPGPNCDVSKALVKRLAIMSDQDVDGISIGVTIVSLIAKHCPQMIDAGMVCRIIPPAYQINGQKNKKKPTFVHTQREFFQFVGKEFMKNTELGYGKKTLSTKDAEALVLKNFENKYSDKLRTLTQCYGCTEDFMEMIAWNYHGEPADQKQTSWNTVLKPYRDIKAIKEGGHIVIHGTMSTDKDKIGNYVMVHIPLDDYFHKRVTKFKAIQNENHAIYGYTINGEKNKSMWDIMSRFDSYIPDDVVRFKGLGELDPEDMWDLCLNPKTREEYVFKFSDFDKDMRKISIIMSSRKEFMEERARIMMNTSLDDIDLDT